MDTIGNSLGKLAKQLSADITNICLKWKADSTWFFLGQGRVAQEEKGCSILGTCPGGGGGGLRA